MKRNVYTQFKYCKAVIGFYSSVTYGATFPAREGLEHAVAASLPAGEGSGYPRTSPTDGMATARWTITTNR